MDRLQYAPNVIVNPSKMDRAVWPHSNWFSNEENSFADHLLFITYKYEDLIAVRVHGDQISSLK